MMKIQFFCGAAGLYFSHLFTSHISLCKVVTTVVPHCTPQVAQLHAARYMQRPHEVTRRT